MIDSKMSLKPFWFVVLKYFPTGKCENRKFSKSYSNVIHPTQRSIIQDFNVSFRFVAYVYLFASSYQCKLSFQMNRYQGLNGRVGSKSFPG